MKNWLRSNRLIALLLCIGLIGTLLLCGIRAGLESENTGVSLIMTRADAETLAEAYGLPAEEYEELLYAAGLTALFTPDQICSELNLYIGDSYHGESAVVGLPEDDRQYSYDPVEGFAYSDSAQVVRVFRLRPEYAARYASLGYDGPQEIENLIYRSITDRNIRVVWLTPFVRADNGALISDPADYVSVIQGIAARIQPHSLQLGAFSTLPPYTPNPLLCLFCIGGLAGAGALLLDTLLPMTSRRRNLLALLCASAGCLIYLRLPWIMPLGAAIVFPCLGIHLMAVLLLHLHPQSRMQALGCYLLILCSGFALALFGGNLVAALQSDRAYLLAVKNFRGVKLSQLLPLVYAVLICLKTFYKGCTLRTLSNEYLDSRLAAAALVLLIALAALYIARTGDGILSVGVPEQRFRNFLENTLIVRPRTKEFLAAWPALGLAVVLMSRDSRRFAMPCTVLSAAGLASVVNTFCHSRSPLWVALSRSALGLLFGFLLGAVLILLLSPAKGRSRA